MPVPVQTGFISHTANGSATSFAYDFLVVKAAHMAVFFDGVKQSSGYTVNDIGVSVGGTVDFSVAPTSGVAVVFRRDVPYGRTDFDYQTAGDFLAETVDLDFDTRTMQIQQLAELLTRALSLSETDPLAGGAYDANSSRIENVTDPVSGQDAATKNSVISETIAQILAAGAIPFQPPITILSPHDVEAYGSYHVDPNSSSIINLPLTPPDGAYVRLYSRDYTSGDLTINAATGEYILEAYMIGDAGAGSSGAILEVGTDHNEMIVDAFIGMTALNTENEESGLITDNDETTITAALTGGESWDSGDGYSIVTSSLVYSNNLAWGMIQLTYRASAGYWFCSVRSATTEGMLTHPAKQAFIFPDVTPTENPNLYEFLKRLDLRLYQHLNPASTELFTTATALTLSLVFSQRDIIWSGSSSCTMTAGTAPGGTDHRGYKVEILNAGSADIIIAKGGWATIVLIDGGVVSNPATVTVPPGEWCKIKSDRVDTLYIWGSAGIS